MKSTIVGVAAFLVLSLITGCSDDPPNVRVENQLATKANVQFKQVNGGTFNQNNVGSATYSAYQDVAEGSIGVSAVIQGEYASPTVTFDASNNNSYTIIIIEGDPPFLIVDTRTK
jgi:hypothetical protein